MKKYLMTFLMLMCVAFCLAGCRKTQGEAEKQNLQEEVLTSQEETPEEEEDGKMQYQETIEMELGEDQGAAVSPAE